ncbi:helix-turn-helix domain-containing protein [Psychroserpens sp. SPM9]|uniref:AraC family transcriptional regulator n=1 Tax=Psychroserpens sp. SPM9 TaxID=2975598 RepID=UPI0021A73E93|nr:helix-turn-helix domain-containing protein [Psychroserpens sp. SPM9]MDG5492629.1 helix-turn-helix domain-containing protein [Psychroserpens sp. SPM9]
MQFKKHKPSKAYEHLIAYFWTITSSEGDDATALYRFVPDAYVDWVFHSGKLWQCDFPNVEINAKTSRFHVFGQIKKYINLTLPSNGLDVFGVKFYPWVASKIWNIDMHYLTDSCLDLSDLEAPRIKALQDQIYSAQDTTTKIAHVERYLSAFVTYSDHKSLKHIFSSLTIDVNHLKTLNVGIGMRRLEQRFKNEIGISPKLFLRTCRINAAIEKMKVKSNQSLTQLALEHHYYDQSHFIKDFIQFTGCNPSQFLKSINPNGDILNLRVG